MSEMDICAYQAVNLILASRSKTAKTAVTYTSNFIFKFPCYVGELIHLKAKIGKTRHKAIPVKVTAYRQKLGSVKLQEVAVGKFVFVSIADPKGIENKPEYLPYENHGIEYDGDGDE